MNDPDRDPTYPRLLRRVRAALVDEIVLLGMLAAWWLGAGIDANLHLAVKLGSLLLLLVLIDPVLVAFTGGTVGHHLMGLKVRSATRDARVGLGSATLRAAIRYGLGWLSLIWILVTRRHQAVHDYASHTLVVLRNPARFPQAEKLGERRGHAL